MLGRVSSMTRSRACRFGLHLTGRQHSSGHLATGAWVRPASVHITSVYACSAPVLFESPICNFLGYTHSRCLSVRSYARKLAPFRLTVKMIRTKLSTLHKFEYRALHTTDTMGFWGCSTFVLLLTMFGILWSPSCRVCAKLAGRFFSIRNRKTLGRFVASIACFGRCLCFHNRIDTAKRGGHGYEQLPL